MDKPKKALKWTGKILVTLLLLAVFLFALPPFRHGIHSIGSYIPMLFSAVTLFFLWCKPLRDKLKVRKGIRLLWRAALCLYFAGIAAFAVLFGMLLTAQLGAPGTEPRTLVVLGCQVRGDDPSPLRGLGRSGPRREPQRGRGHETLACVRRRRPRPDLLGR